MFEYNYLDDLNTSNLDYTSELSSKENKEINIVNKNTTLDENLYNSSSWQYIKSNSLHEEILKLKQFLLEELKKSEVELTVKTKIEDFISDNYNDEMYVALSEIFIENIDDHDLVIKIIRALTLIPYKKLNSGVKLLVNNALYINDYMVKQQAIQAFGIWSDKTTIKLLSNVECSEKWFENYLLKIINGIKQKNEC